MTPWLANVAAAVIGKSMSFKNDQAYKCAAIRYYKKRLFPG
jgi:hypothetical protein